MLKPQIHIIRFFVLSLFIGFMMLDFAATFHVVFNDTGKVSQLLVGDEENTEESNSDESSEKEEKSGKENLSSFLTFGNASLLPFISNLSFIKSFGEDLLKDCHLSFPTPPPELL